MKSFRKALWATGAIAGGALITAGCGTGNGIKPSAETSTETATGRATLTVRWPERREGRLVPLLANSLSVTVTQSSFFYEKKKVFPRPPGGGVSTVELDRLPTGNVMVIVLAHPDTDGSEVALASAVAPAKVSHGQVTPLRVTMQSTIYTLEIAASQEGILNVGQQRKFTAVAKSAHDEVVMTHSDNLVWTTKDPAIATVAPDGTVTGMASGQTQVEVREIESGKTQSAVLVVR